MGNTTVPEKPVLRGVIHGIAFILLSLLAVIFFVFSSTHRCNFSVVVYIFSQLLQFGASSLYHIPPWPPRVKRILRHIDHMCIFILISGTQTSVLLTNLIARSNPLSQWAISLSWTISAIGILKILILNKLHNIFDLIVYILHGAIIIPFYKLVATFDTFDKFMIFAGGFLYIFGGIIYGLERPNFHPRVFGFHELFHVFTVVANFCFSIVVGKQYFRSLQ